MKADFVLNDLRDVIHDLAKSKGWHAAEETDDQFVTRTCANIHGEVSELFEAFRDNRLHAPCDKAEMMGELGLARLTCAEEELADIIIRALDTAGRLKIDIGRAVMAKHTLNVVRPWRHGGKRA